jgi:hypothetical protein
MGAPYVSRFFTFRSAMLCRLLAVIAHNSGIDLWDSIGSIVGGAIAALVLTGACVRWLWGKRHAPKIAVTAWDSDVYRRDGIPEPRHRISDQNGYRVAVTRLQVRETNNAAAKDVHLRVVQTEPSPSDPMELPAGLQWVTGADDLSLPPKSKSVCASL